MCAKLKLPKNVNKNNKNSKIVVSALDLTVQKMAMEIKNFSMEIDEFEDLQCDNSEYLLNPGDKI